MNPIFPLTKKYYYLIAVTEKYFFKHVNVKFILSQNWTGNFTPILKIIIPDHKTPELPFDAPQLRISPLYCPNPLLHREAFIGHYRIQLVHKRCPQTQQQRTRRISINQIQEGLSTQFCWDDEIKGTQMDGTGSSFPAHQKCIRDSGQETQW